MLIPAVAVLEALFYLCAVPVCGAFRLSTRGALRFGVGVSLFQGRAALRRAEHGRPAPKGSRNAGKRALRAALRLKGARLRLQGCVGLGDAAATACACGALTGLAGALGSRLGRVEVDVKPRFDGNAPCLELQGMLRVPAGQIIAALAQCGAHDIVRRITTWKDTRLKA